MKNKFFSFWGKVWAEKWLFLLCFILAVLAWQGIRRNIGHKRSVPDIPVELKLPEGWTVWEKSAKAVNILFSGSPNDIRYLNNEQLRVVIPLPNPTAENEIHIKLSEKHLQNTTEARVIRFIPSDLFIKLDKEVMRPFPVKAAITGSLPEGIEIDKIICTPASVQVSGAEQILNKTKNIQTEPINLTDHQTSFKLDIPVLLPQGDRMQATPQRVSVHFILAQRNSTEDLKNIPVRIVQETGIPRKMILSPQTVTITVKGNIKRIEQVRTANLFAYINCTGLHKTTGYDLPVDVDLPEGLQLIKTDPATVHVDITRLNQDLTL